jgi:hypothetical protein
VLPTLRRRAYLAQEPRRAVQHKPRAIKPAPRTHRPEARLEKLLREKCRHDRTQNDGRDQQRVLTLIYDLVLKTE